MAAGGQNPNPYLTCVLNYGAERAFNLTSLTSKNSSCFLIEEPEIDKNIGTFLKLEPFSCFNYFWGATTPSITTRCVTTFSISHNIEHSNTALSGLNVILKYKDIECFYAECRISFCYTNCL